MKKLLKKLALLPLFCGLVLTSACSNDDDNGNDIPTSWFDGTITATVENGNNYNDLIAEVVAFALSDRYGDEIVARGIWSNGGFTITLPETLDDKFFESDGHGLLEDFPSASISDKNIRLAFVGDEVTLDVLNDNGDFIGFLFWGNSDVWARFVYADRDAIITGRESFESYTFTVNMSLKRGWNVVYYINLGGRNEIMTTEPVSNLRWYFHSWSDWWSSAPMATKSTTQSRSFFSRLGR